MLVGAFWDPLGDHILNFAEGELYFVTFWVASTLFPFKCFFRILFQLIWSILPVFQRWTIVQFSLSWFSEFCGMPVCSVSPPFFATYVVLIMHLTLRLPGHTLQCITSGKIIYYNVHYFENLPDEYLLISAHTFKGKYNDYMSAYYVDSPF